MDNEQSINSVSRRIVSAISTCSITQAVKTLLRKDEFAKKLPENSQWLNEEEFACNRLPSTDTKTTRSKVALSKIDAPIETPDKSAPTSETPEKSPLPKRPS